MSTAPPRVFAARLVGLPIFDPQGDQVAKVRDLVVGLMSGRTETARPRVLGMVAEVFGRRRIFVPMTRVTHIDSGQVYTTGVLNLRRFEQRPTETLVMGQMLDRAVTIRSSGVQGTVFDVAMEQARNRDWVLSRVAVQEPVKGLRRRGQSHVAEWEDVDGLTRHEETQGATRLIAALNEMRPADAANVLHDLPSERRVQVVAAMDDERLADVLEELPEEDQVEILEHLDSERAADILEEMSPDDAADLIADLPPDTAASLLALMDPEDREDVRRLMEYGEETAGGMMTPEPVILPPDATVAEALAHVRREELPTSLAAQVYVCRPPLETPDRPAARAGAHPAAAARAPVHAGGRACSTARRRTSRPTPRCRTSPCTSPSTTSRRRRSSTTTAGCSARSPWTTCSTTSCPTAGATARPVSGDLTPERKTEKKAEARTEERRVQRLDTPLDSRRPLLVRPSYDADAVGIFAEQFARFMGTARFLFYMTFFVLVWVGWNALAPEEWRWDPYPFIFLTLMLSLQASYAAPLILLAQNRQEFRDKVIAEQDRQANARAHADMEFLAREVASLRMAMGEVATRDFLRSELRSLLTDLEEQERQDEAQPTPPEPGAPSPAD